MGNPFVHLDLATDDIAAAKAFYGAVFDWKFSDMPDMNWSGIDVGEGTGGGIGGKNMPGQPTAWTAYVQVTDVNEAIAKAEKAGAQIIVPYMKVGEMGCLGIFVDPQGATLGVWQSLQPPPVATKTGKKKAAK
ncbi:MAG: VOC family protein, partial [Myxococcales bacterium]|nr:VOC family protein [Myxococcales bacterium]